MTIQDHRNLQCSTQPTGSSPALTKPLSEVAQALTDLDCSPHSHLLPIDECRGFLAAHQAISAKTSPSDAARYAKAIISLYRKAEVIDPEFFITSLAANLAEFPLPVVATVAHPVRGIAARSKFFPALAEIVAACEHERARRENLAAKATWIIREHDRRQIEREERERIAAITPERRAELAAMMRSALSKTYLPKDEEEAA